MTIEVQMISASWCKRCDTMKPDVAALCKISDATLVILDYDEMEEDDALKLSIKSLPTIRMGSVSVSASVSASASASGWKAYTAAEYDQWKKDITALSLKNVSACTDF